MSGSGDSRNGRTALVLLRTPFQAHSVHSILKSEGVKDYELVYFTQHDSPEDRYYYSLLETNATEAQYCFAPLRRFDILAHLDFGRQARHWFRNRHRDLTILSSIDAFVPNAIAARQTGAELVCFDDGTGNLIKTGLVHIDHVKGRGRLYRRYFGALDLKTIRSRIVRHYTLYPQFENIVPAEKLRPLTGWTDISRKRKADRVRSYFIGGPFHLIMTKKQIANLRNFLRTQNIDRYVRHPMELEPLDIGAPQLDKEGRIAEDAIIRDAGEARIHLFGVFSTVLFNLGSFAERRVAILARSAQKSEEMAELAAKAGCELMIL